MKVIYFAQHFSTPQGSAGMRAYEMAKNLIANGHQVTLVCGSYKGAVTGLTQEFLNGSRRGNVDGIDVIEFNLPYANISSFPRRAYIFLKFAMLSIGVALTEKYDILFSTSTPLTAGIPGVVARWLLGKPFVFEVRDLWPELPKAMGVIKNPIFLHAMSILEWISYHSAHRIIGLSPGIVNGIERRGVDVNRITMIPNGCDSNIFAIDVSPWRPDGVTSNDFIAVFSGTHGKANGLDAVIDAAWELNFRGCKNIKFVLIGEGKLKFELRERAKRENLTNIIFLDPVNKKRLAGLLAASDVGLQILANIKEFYYGTSPNKFFDYLAAGLPVLNNYPGWVADIIKENECGFTTSPGNAVEFADVLEWAATNRGLLKKMGQNSRKLSETNFSRKIQAQHWVKCVIGVKSEANI